LRQLPLSTSTLPSDDVSVLVEPDPYPMTPVTALTLPRLEAESVPSSPPLPTLRRFVVVKVELLTATDPMLTPLAIDELNEVSTAPFVSSTVPSPLDPMCSSFPLVHVERSPTEFGSPSS
jgi:hypothetical protein